jgi:Glucosyl transferase GtrII
MISQVVSEANRFVRNSRALLGWLLVGTLVYGFAITNGSLSIDEELGFFFKNPFAWAEQGRWGIWLLKLVFGTFLPLPFFQPALAVLVLAGSALLWSFVFTRASDNRLLNSPWLTFFAVVYLTLPLNAYYLSFNTYNFEISCGLVFSALSVLFAWMWQFEQGGQRAFATSAMFSTLAISTYQSFAIVCAGGILATYLLHLTTLASLPSSAEIVRKSFYLGVPLIVGCAFYLGVSLVVLAHGSYVDSLFKWGKQDNAFILKWLWQYVVEFFRGGAFSGGRSVSLLAIAGLVSLAILVWRAARTGSIAPPLILLALFGSPFYLSFALGMPMNARTQQVVPVVYGAFVLLLILQLRLEQRARMLALVATVLAVTWNGQANTRLFLSEYFAFKRDEAIAHRLAEQLSQSGWNGDAVPLAVIGRSPGQPEIFPRSDTFGASFFAWENGTRAAYFMQLLGYPFVSPSAAQWKTALAVSESLSDWPRRGSVRFVDGVAIVRMSQGTDAQYRQYGE